MNTKRPKSPKTNRKSRRSAMNIVKNRSSVQGTMTVVAKRLKIDIAKPTTKNAESSEGMIFGSIMTANLVGLLTAVASLRADRETASQWDAKSRKQNDSLSRAGYTIAHAKVAKIASDKKMLEVVWMQGICSAFEGDAMEIAQSSLSRNDMTTNALRAYRLLGDLHSDLIDKVFGNAWRSLLADAEGLLS